MPWLRLMLSLSCCEGSTFAFGALIILCSENVFLDSLEIDEEISYRARIQNFKSNINLGRKYHILKLQIKWACNELYLQWIVGCFVCCRTTCELLYIFIRVNTKRSLCKGHSAYAVNIFKCVSCVFEIKLELIRKLIHIIRPKKLLCTSVEENFHTFCGALLLLMLIK